MKRTIIEIPEEKNIINDLYLTFCIRDCIEREEIPCIFSEYPKSINWYELANITAFYCDMKFTDEMKSKKNKHLNSCFKLLYDYRWINEELWKEFKKIVVSLGFEEPKRMEGLYF